MDEQKKCRGCNEEKPLEEFHRDSRTRDGRSSRCAECRSRKAREWYARDPEHVQAVDRAYYQAHREEILAKQRLRDEARARLRPVETRRARALYMREWRRRNIEVRKDLELRARNGFSLEGYHELLAGQGGVCYICQTPPAEGKYLCVDHCHSTGRVRGLLCRACNLGISNLKEDPVFFARAAQYLREKP